MPPRGRRAEHRRVDTHPADRLDQRARGSSADATRTDRTCDGANAASCRHASTASRTSCAPTASEYPSICPAMLPASADPGPGGETGRRAARRPALEPADEGERVEEFPLHGCRAAGEHRPTTAPRAAPPSHARGHAPRRRSRRTRSRSLRAGRGRWRSARRWCWESSGERRSDLRPADRLSRLPR